MTLLLLRVLLFAGECLAVTLVMPPLAFVITALLRRAALRHLALTALFSVLALLPFAALLLPPRRIVEHVAAPVLLPVSGVTVAAAPVMAPPPSLLTFDNAVLLLAALWAAGLVWHLLRLALGGLGLMRLRRRSTMFAAELATGCDVRLSDGANGPSTFGILRPVILLPRAAQDWPAARLDAVLRHEAAHVARRDAASQLLARLICAVWWFNPLLWLAYRALRREAEIAADDAVLAGGMTPSVYAAELVGLAAERNGWSPGIAMAAPPLARRLQAVLAENSSHKGVTRMDMARTLTFGLAATLLLGVARFDLAVAQDAPSAPPPADSSKGIPGEITLQQQPSGAVMFHADRMTKNGDTVVLESGKNRAILQQQAAQMKQQALQIGDPSLPGAVRAAQAQALSREALAQAQAALAAKAAAMKDAAPEKQKLVQMAANAVAQAAQAQQQEKDGLVPNLSYFSNTNDVKIDIQLPLVKGLDSPELQEAFRNAVTAAMADAGQKIRAAFAEARAKAGLSAMPAPEVHGTWNYDVVVPDGALPARSAAPAIPAPPPSSR